MTASEKYLYHQIHPLKLLTDVAAGFIALYPLWQHRLALAVLIMLAPPPVASFLVMRYANLEPYKQSALGRYLARHMTHTVEAIRLLGMIVTAFGAWFHSVAAIVLGVVVTILAWTWGLLPASGSRSTG
ncbi:MAG TPA: hypothetical protein VKE26_12100 [Xanthobacteraceae bacterium]|nr:hypothetical protein [Xanthobacteraceae bacterium]